MATPRPNLRRYDLGIYPDVMDVPPRFNDMDALRHLNNVALAAVYEEGRIALHRKLAMDELREKNTRTVVAQVNIGYLLEGSYPDMLTIGGGISRIGKSSYEICQGLFQNGRCIGVCDTVIVNTHDGRSHPLTGAWKARLETLRIEGTTDV
ncbi:MAG: acyl-CoA thioesterase [Caulobacteraceae bacterium]